MPKSRLRDPKEKAGDFFDGFGIKRRGTNTTKSCASTKIYIYIYIFVNIDFSEEMKSLGSFCGVFFPDKFI